MGSGDKLRAVVSFVSKTLVVGEDPSKRRIVTLALIDQHTNELCLDKLVVPLPGRADALVKKRRNRRLKTRIIATVGTTVVPAIDRFGFCGK